MQQAENDNARNNILGRYPILWNIDSSITIKYKNTRYEVDAVFKELTTTYNIFPPVISLLISKGGTKLINKSDLCYL